MTRLRLTFVIILLAGLAACGDPPEDGLHVGYVEAEYVYVAAPQSGWIETLFVHEGDHVEVGDILFQLDKAQEETLREEAASRVAQADAQARDLASGARPAEIAALQAQLDDVEAQLVYAQSELDRSLPLIDEGIIAGVAGDRLVAERDRAQARVDAAEETIGIARLAGRDAARDGAEAARGTADAALAQVDWRLAQRTVIARASGHVELIVHREGEYVAPGAPVLAILPGDALKIRTFIPQAYLSNVTVGRTVEVFSDGLAAPVEARVSYIASEAEFTPPVIYSAESREKLVFAVEAHLPKDTGLRPGLPVDVRIP